MRGWLNRLKADFLLPNQSERYASILQTALEAGYNIIPHSEFYEKAQNNKLNDGKWFLVRHDIDSDPNYCRQWLKVEAQLKVRVGYYFRLCTLSPSMIRLVQEAGHDCGYHYEELADYAKAFKIKSADEIRRKFPEIRKKFVLNFKQILPVFNDQIPFICSHGDFANRALGVNNWEIITEDLKEELGIRFECYETIFVNNYSINISDGTYPNIFKGDISPEEAIRGDFPIIHLLTHPRYARANPYWNIKQNIERIIQGFQYAK